jgi:ferritin-like metal-binding protein YciE
MRFANKRLRDEEEAMRTFIADLDASEPIRLVGALATGKKVAPDVTGLLADDHRTVLGWFRWYEQASDPTVRRRLSERICVALKAHMAGEEGFLYPALKDREVAERAFGEHAGAKTIMKQIEAGADEAALDGLMNKLQREIVAHVAEEETELFAAARRSGIDLYALGRAVAAERADTLLQLRSPKGAPPTTEQEIPTMQVSQKQAREYFLVGLKNAHATTRQGRVLVNTQLERLENYPQMKAKLAEHLDEKDAQLERLERLLEACGESPSAMKDTAMAMAAGVAGVASAAASDEVVKNSFATLAQAKYEAAAFETLIVFAEAAGEPAALRPLQQCLSESRGLAAFIEENLRPTAVRFLALRTEGRQAKR